MDLGNLIRVSKRDFTKITSSPRLRNIGIHSLTVLIRDPLDYKLLMHPLPFVVEVLPPIKLPDFTCTLGPRKLCLPKILSISN